MNKHLLSLSIASVIALAGSMPAVAEECVEVQTRFALANCMVESAVAIAAAAAGETNCAAAEWNIKAVVEEHIYQKIPIQGFMQVDGNGDSYVLGASSSAMLKNNVNCSISTTSSGNTFAGSDLTYAAEGSHNYYVDAILEPGSSTVCISDAESSADIQLGEANLDETNSLTFTASEEEEYPQEIDVTGNLSIQTSGGKGQGQGNPPAEEVSDWDIEAEVIIPEVNTVMDEAYDLEAVTIDIGNCVIEVEASVANNEYYNEDTLEGGLVISGSISIEPDEEEDE